MSCWHNERSGRDESENGKSDRTSQEYGKRGKKDKTAGMNKLSDSLGKRKTWKTAGVLKRRALTETDDEFL